MCHPRRLAPSHVASGSSRTICTSWRSDDSRLLSAPEARAKRDRRGLSRCHPTSIRSIRSAAAGIVEPVADAQRRRPRHGQGTPARDQRLPWRARTTDRVGRAGERRPGRRRRVPGDVARAAARGGSRRRRGRAHRRRRRHGRRISAPQRRVPRRADRRTAVGAGAGHDGGGQPRARRGRGGAPETAAWRLSSGGRLPGRRRLRRRGLPPSRRQRRVSTDRPADPAADRDPVHPGRSDRHRRHCPAGHGAYREPRRHLQCHLPRRGGHRQFLCGRLAFHRHPIAGPPDS